MKQPVEWDEDYVLNLPPGEHDWVEFKSSKMLDFSLLGGNINDVLNELSKQISAFANSGGGTLVYGVQDAPAGTARKVDKDGGVSLNLKSGTKEWLEDVIPNLVDFPINSFNVYVEVARNTTSGIAQGKGLFFIQIPSSDSAPHQAKDNKYYARVGGKSRPIGHRLVMDIVGRAQYPKLQVSCRIIPREKRAEYHNRDALRFVCRNVGKIFANYVNGYLFIPAGLHYGGKENLRTLDDKEFVEIYFDNTREDIVGWRDSGLYGSKPLTISRYDPVLPKLGFSTTVDLAVRKEQLNEFRDEEIQWVVYADNAPKEEGKIQIANLLLDTSAV